jgi:hypothetical protein
MHPPSYIHSIPFIHHPIPSHPIPSIHGGGPIPSIHDDGDDEKWWVGGGGWWRMMMMVVVMMMMMMVVMVMEMGGTYHRGPSGMKGEGDKVLLFSSCWFAFVWHLG